MIDYIFQISLRKGTTDYAICVTYDFVYNCVAPVGGLDHLGNENFPVDITFIYGDKDSDWVLQMEGDFA